MIESNICASEAEKTGKWENEKVGRWGIRSVEARKRIEERDEREGEKRGKWENVKTRKWESEIKKGMRTVY